MEHFLTVRFNNETYKRSLLEGKYLFFLKLRIIYFYIIFSIDYFK